MEEIIITKYNPEVYWSCVANEIEKRGENYIAGDDNSYFRYKRTKFLHNFLNTIDFELKDVLEVGFGPGGNLKHIATYHSPKRLFGVDISEKMVEIAMKNLSFCNIVELKKTDGLSIPYPDQFVDISYTVTVLQHNTDENMIRSLVRELCRVTKGKIIIMEDIGSSATLSGPGSYIKRQVEVYNSLFAEYGFQLDHVQFLNTKISRLWYITITSIYNLFCKKRHLEGESLDATLLGLIDLSMQFTHSLDNILIEEEDLAKLVFNRI